MAGNVLRAALVQRCLRRLGARGDSTKAAVLPLANIRAIGDQQESPKDRVLLPLNISHKNEPLVSDDKVLPGHGLAAVRGGAVALAIVAHGCFCGFSCTAA